jgi:DNA-binding Lrp family transcriptional regulator
MNELDHLDYLILGELLLDPQRPFIQISKKLKVSSFTVGNRYDKMIKEGIIGKPTINIDLSKLGYQGKTFLLITSAGNQQKESTINELEKIRNILLISEVIGSFDIIVVAPSVDFNSIAELVRKVKSIPGVERVNLSFVNGTSFPFDRSYRETLSQRSLKTAIKLSSQKSRG